MIFLVIAVIFGVIGAAMASSRNRSVVGWFLACFFFPIIGIIILAAVGKAQS